MRVAMVILEYAPIMGGAQRQLAAVAPLLQARGIDVQVLTRRFGDLPAREEVAGVPVHRLPAPGPKATASLTFTAAALARLVALRPDVVHAYSLFSPSTIAMLARHMLRVPTVVKVLRGGVDGELERLRSKPFSRLRLARTRVDFDRFVTIADEIDAELEDAGVADARRMEIPNGVDIGRYRPATPAERGPLRAELGLRDAPTAIFCGRLVREKNVDVLFEAWRDVRRQHPLAELLIVGAGPEEQRLRGLAVAGVRFMGERQDVAPLLRACDAFVLPSATEGLSNALLEAMSSGLPVVATRVGAAPALVDEAATGHLVAAGDAAALGAALSALLSNPERFALGARGREKAVADYSLDSVADRLAGLYGELVARARAAGAAPRPAVASKGGDA